MPGQGPLSGRFGATEIQKAKRREAVNELRLRGHSITAIPALLEAKYDIVNTKTGQPYSYQLIQQDINYLKENWQEINADDYEKLRQCLWQEIDLVKKEAWSAGRFDIILKSIAQQAKLMGLNCETTQTEINAYLNTPPELTIEIVGDKNVN